MNKKVFMCFIVVLLSLWMLSPLQGMTDKQVAKKGEKERVEFKNLLLKNPNYFGTVAGSRLKAVKKISYNTSYEQLMCVGLYPEKDLLEAVIKIKRTYGYGGDLCSNGTKEYVSFFIDYGDGNGFVSVGAPAEVNVHSLTAVSQGAIYYAVRKAFTPKQVLPCGTPQIVKVKAILSWESIPTGPSYPPVWGNVMERWVQIRPWKPIVVVPWFEFLEAQKYQFPPLVEKIPETLIPEEKFFVMGNLKEIKDYVTNAVGEGDVMKKDVDIEPERSKFKKLISKNINYFGSISTSKDEKEIKKAVLALPELTKKYLYQATIDYKKLAPYLVYLNKTSYEELKCVGLYPEEDLLEAVIEIKRPYGYGGDLCRPGTPEYVVFYIDWGFGFKYAATTSVRVHNIPDVNGKHLFYAVRAKIPNIDTRLKDCNNQNIVKVKAILSWDYDPTLLGHNYTPAWGNVLARRIQIRPDTGPSAECELELVNEVHVDDISPSGVSKGLSIKIDSGGLTVPGTYDKPFAGVIGCWGNINIPGATYYRFRYKESGATDWENITNTRKARAAGGWTITRTPDGDGWFSKSEYDTDVINYSIVALVHWNSGSRNGQYQIQLQVGDAANTVISEDDCWILLDNVAPSLYKFGGTLPAFPCIGIAVKDTAGSYKKCLEFNGSEAIKVYGNFDDDYFRNYHLTVFGGNLDVSGVFVRKERYDGTDPGITDTGIVGASDGSMGQLLESINLCDNKYVQNPKAKCAYGFHLRIYDRAIRGYISGYQFRMTCNGRNAYITFNWDPNDPADPTKSCPGYTP